METFTKLFGSLLACVYKCFDRMVIQGFLPLLTRPSPRQYTCLHLSYFSGSLGTLCDSTRSTYSSSALFGHSSIHTSARGLPV
jgi:hypothetical protein